ncbi:hypothetical protein HMPREF1420_01671 [Helicobacter pylori GAM264Ai]|nr:hypothetical protein HMPREF1420_01671 [Helicobacter pylori GAM264Ai]
MCYYFQISSLKSVNWHDLSDLRMMGVCFKTLRLSLYEIEIMRERFGFRV